MAVPSAIATAPGPRLWEKVLFGMPAHQAPILLPGLALALLVAHVANLLGTAAGEALLRVQGIDPAGKASPVSGIAVAVVLGLLIANSIRLNPIFGPGLEFAMKKILRLGIILVGIKLSIVDVLKVGAIGIPVVIAVVGVGIGVTLWIARKAGVGSRLATLAAASTAICGITATVAVAPAIGADDREVAYTVANVTLFGLVAMLAYPYLAHALFAEHPGAAGLFLGTAIHETSQVMGAALTYKEVFSADLAAQVATVAKLTRNALLVAVVPTLAFLYARSGAERQEVTLSKLFPVFVLGFIAMSLVRTAGDLGVAGNGLAFGVLEAPAWSHLTRTVGEKVAALLLGTALAGVGLTTTFGVFRNLGFRPLLIGMTAALAVGIVSLALAAAVGPALG